MNEVDESKEIQLDLFFDQPIPAVVKELTWKQAAKIFWIAHWRHKKFGVMGKSIWDNVDAFFEHRTLQTIGKQDVENLQRHLRMRKGRMKKGYLSTSSQNKVRMYVTLLFNKFYEWRDDGFIEGHDVSNLLLPKMNPGMRVARQKERPRDIVVTPWDFGRILVICRRLRYTNVAEILKFAVWLRMSPIDLRELSDHHVRDGSMQIVKGRGHTRTDSNPEGVIQQIPITERMWGRIRRLQLFRPPGVTRILDFTNFRRRLNVVRRTARAEGLQDFQLRDLRRSGATYLLYDGGMDLKTVSKGLGHTSTKITESNYTPLPEKKLIQSSQLLEKAFDGKTGA
jgi:integrase